MNLKTNPELLPLVEWWEKDGKQTVLWIAVAAIAVGGWYGWKNHRAQMREAASEALASAYTTEELQDAVVKFDGTATSGALKLRLAKNYFDTARYQEALDLYDELGGKADAIDGFADVPAVGRAMCLEALGRFDEAGQAFKAFSDANPTNYLTLTAKLGYARAQAETGKKAAALAYLAELKKGFGEKDLSWRRIDITEQAVKRYDPSKAAPVAPVAAPAADLPAVPAPAADAK